MRKRVGAARLLATTAAAASAILLAAGTAAAYDDSMNVYTIGRCGSASFVDYGPGASGGGDNDDYIEITDMCADNHGVRADLHWVHASGAWDDWSTMYDGKGAKAAPVIWDPFSYMAGNVVQGDTVTLTMCLVDGEMDGSGDLCQTRTFVSQDG